MATAAVSRQGPVWVESTKGLNCDDPFAKLILPDFIDLVDPKHLIMYLPPDLLTAADEGRVVTKQDSMGREDAARLLLALMSQRGDWIPRLQEGLRHRQIRLENLADKLDSMQGEVAMEVDLDDHPGNMEVDAEPWQEDEEGGGPVQGGDAPVQARADRHVQEGIEQQQGADPGQILREIARRFFLEMARSPEEVRTLTEMFERIAAVVTTSYAIGCLELRMRMATSHDVRELRRLVESGVLQQSAERTLLTEERRDKLTAMAAAFGMKWNRMKLKVSVRKEDLDRCETFLTAREETAMPRSPAEALLLKAVTANRTAADNTAPDLLHQPMPELLLSFLDWLLQGYPDLAEKVATILATSTLEAGIVEMMAECRGYFQLANEHWQDVVTVSREMLSSALANKEREEAVKGDEARLPFSESQLLTTEAPLSSQASSALFVEVPFGPHLAGAVERLEKAKLMIPCHVPGREDTFGFTHSFVTDSALCNSLVTEDNFYDVLRFGSNFVMLHIAAFLLSVPLEKLAARTINYPMLYMLGDYHPLAVTEMGLASMRLWALSNDDTRFFQRVWWTFGPEWKKLCGAARPSRWYPDFAVVRLCPLSSTEEVSAIEETVTAILSSRHSVDLTGKLENLESLQLRVVLACVQLTNVASFQFLGSRGNCALQVIPDIQEGRREKRSFAQPALKLCHNRLEDMHVECLIRALPGLECVSHFDLTGCSLSQDNLQRLLNSLSARSVKILTLGKISFIDSRSHILPRFSHLKSLQAIDLSSLGLHDKLMPQLVEQLQALPDLRELTLEQNPITTEGLSVLTPALASRPSLRVLRLSQCQQLDAGGAFVLGAALTSARDLHVLTLSQCPLQDSGLHHLALTLKHHTQLSKVALREGGYSPNGLAPFLSLLSTCPRMQHLEMGRCPLEADGFDVTDKLVKALAGSSQWDYLGLWQCRVGHTDLLERLSTLTIQLRGLTTLVLQENNLGDENLGHLATAVERGVFRYLSHLNLRQNGIKEAGAERLAQVLPFLPHLTELLLQNSAIPPSGVISLARAVLRLPRMTLLELSDNDAMDDATSVVHQIKQIVDREEAIIGEGVGFARSDAQKEDQYVLEKLQRLSFLDLKFETREEAATTEGKEAKASPEAGGITTGDKPEEAEKHPEASRPVPAILHGVEGDTDIAEGSLPAADEVHPRAVDCRKVAEPTGYGDGLIVDGVLRINLGHQ